MDTDKYAINKDYNYLYYVKDNKIKYYDIELRKTKLLYTFSNEEKVSYIHHSKYEPQAYDYSTWTYGPVDKEHWFNNLIVATHANGKYKVYLFEMTIAGGIKSNPTILEGEGRVADVLYISSFLNNGGIANHY